MRVNAPEKMASSKGKSFQPSIFRGSLIVSFGRVNGTHFMGGDQTLDLKNASLLVTLEGFVFQYCFCLGCKYSDP